MLYIQIAAYRDPELLPTIADCLEKAKFKTELTFGICWQRCDGDRCLEPFLNDKQFRIDVVPWQISQGLCWARSRIQAMYEGEDYTLQIDSHHRFAQDWDAQLIQFLELTDSRKPILTTYAGMYTPKEDNDEDITGYDLGTVRTHREYEIYAGIDFVRRRLHKETVQGREPPCAYVNDAQWEESFVSEYNVTLKWETGKIEKCDDFQFIYFGVEDDCGNVLYRHDAAPDSPEATLSIAKRDVSIRSAYKPSKLVVWPVSKSRGWLQRVDYRL